MLAYNNFYGFGQRVAALLEVYLWSIFHLFIFILFFHAKFSSHNSFYFFKKIKRKVISIYEYLDNLIRLYTNRPFWYNELT